MSWDVYVMRFPADIQDPEEIPGDWQPPSLGSGRQVRDKLREVLPEMYEVVADGGFGYEGHGFSLGINFDVDDEQVTCVSLTFHGGGSAAGVAVAITEALQARAIETGNGGFLERDNAAAALAAFQRYRDHVIQPGRPTSG